MSEHESDPSVPFESKRVPFERTVILKFDRFSGFIKEYSANISMGGMFIRTNQMQEPGSVFEFVFKLADDYNLIQGLGEVVWLSTEDDESPLPPGMGIRFLELDWESRKLIFRLVDQYIQEGGVPFDVEQGPGARGAGQAEEQELLAALSLDDEENLQDVVDEEVEGVISAAPWPDDPGMGTKVPPNVSQEAAAAGSGDIESDEPSDVARAAASEEHADFELAKELAAAGVTEGESAALEASQEASEEAPQEVVYEAVDEMLDETDSEEAPPEPSAGLLSVESVDLHSSDADSGDQAILEEEEAVDFVEEVAPAADAATDVEMPEDTSHATYAPYGEGMAASGSSEKKRAMFLLPLALVLLAFVAFFWMARGSDDADTRTADAGSSTNGVSGVSSEVSSTVDGGVSTPGSGAETAAGSVDGGSVDSAQTTAEGGSAAADGTGAGVVAADEGERLKDRQDPESKEAWKQAKASVRSWAAAWSNQDAEGYLSFYSRDYQPADGVVRSAWAATRRQRIKSPSYVGVELSDVKLKLTKPGMAQAEFVQRYESNSFSDVVTKVLTLTWEDGQWKILEEQVVG